MSDVNAIDARIKAFIQDKFPLAKKQGLKNSDPLLESGILDSLGVLDVVGFLEKEFALHIEDEELSPDNFRNVDTIAEFVRKKTALNAGRVA